jgi:hypothetical protein
MGKGYENVGLLGGKKHAKVSFMDIGNIHVMRESQHKLGRGVHATERQGEGFFGAVHDSGWMHHVSMVLRASVLVAARVAMGYAVVVHCSDGWDRTSQLCATAQLLLDPYYRTIQGFRVLVEKDWCSFGHMFRVRQPGVCACVCVCSCVGE